MDVKEWERRVKELSGLDEPEARRATVAVLSLVRDAISPAEAHDLGSQLPRGFQDILWSRRNDPSPAKQIAWDDMLNQVRSTLAPTSQDEVKQVTRAIFTVLGEAITPGELDDIAGDLPPEAQRALRPG